jgi:hypothetical protein
MTYSFKHAPEAEKNEPQPPGAAGVRRRVIGGKGLGGFTRRLTDNDGAGGLFRCFCRGTHNHSEVPLSGVRCASLGAGCALIGLYVLRYP